MAMTEQSSAIMPITELEVLGSEDAILQLSTSTLKQ